MAASPVYCTWDSPSCLQEYSCPAVESTSALPLLDLIVDYRYQLTTARPDASVVTFLEQGLLSHMADDLECDPNVATTRTTSRTNVARIASAPPDVALESCGTDCTLVQGYFTVQTSNADIEYFRTLVQETLPAVELPPGVQGVEYLAPTPAPVAPALAAPVAAAPVFVPPTPTESVPTSEQQPDPSVEKPPVSTPVDSPQDTPVDDVPVDNVPIDDLDNAPVDEAPVASPTDDAAPVAAPVATPAADETPVAATPPMDETPVASPVVDRDINNGVDSVITESRSSSSSDFPTGFAVLGASILVVLCLVCVFVLRRRRQTKDLNDTLSLEDGSLAHADSLALQPQMERLAAAVAAAVDVESGREHSLPQHTVQTLKITPPRRRKSAELTYSSDEDDDENALYATTVDISNEHENLDRLVMGHEFKKQQLQEESKERVWEVTRKTSRQVTFHEEVIDAIPRREDDFVMQQQEQDYYDANEAPPQNPMYYNDEDEEFLEEHPSRETQYLPHNDTVFSADSQQTDDDLVVSDSESECTPRRVLQMT